MVLNHSKEVDNLAVPVVQDLHLRRLLAEKDPGRAAKHLAITSV